MCVTIPLSTIGLVFDLAGAILIGGYAFRVLSPKHLTGRTGKRIADWPVGMWLDGFNPNTAGLLFDIVGSTLMVFIGVALHIYGSLADKHVCSLYLPLTVALLACLIVFYFKKRRWLVFWRAGKTEHYDGG
ncbi:MAG: hypothetical protein OXF42_06495 [Candidatus Dadabacteria bacterium]|nr:hypothetical protein [Candidatus Dadabacteria bacterium]